MEQKNSSTIVYILSMLGGALTAVFLIFLLMLLGAIENITSGLVASGLMIITAILLSRHTSKPFLDAISITLYAAGCIVPFLLKGESVILFTLFVGVSIATYLFCKGFILSFLAVVMFTVSLSSALSLALSEYYTLWIAGIPILLFFVLFSLFGERLQNISLGKYLRYKSIQAGLFVSTFVLITQISVYQPYDWYLSPCIWACFLVVVNRVIHSIKVEKRSMQCAIYLISLATLALTLHAPYLSGSLLLIFLCFHCQHLKEFAVSILLLIYALIKYYDDLNVTLLTKSMILLATGIIFLTAWYFLTQKKKRHEEI